MNNDLISIIVPVYNVEKYIVRCLESILSQTYKNIEVIIVNDGSVDKSGEICERYAKKDNRIKLINKSNGGLSDARNKGIDQANGIYITFVDSDDYISQNYVEILYKLIKENNADISICDKYEIYKDNMNVRSETKIIENVYNSKEVITKLLYGYSYYVSAWAKMYKKELFNNIRFPYGKLYEDIGTTYLTYLNSTKIAVTNQKLYYYIIRTNSITSGSFTKKQNDMIVLTDSMCDNILKHYPDLKRETKRRRVQARFSTLGRMIDRNYLNKDEMKELRRYILKNAGIVFDINVNIKDKLAIVSLFFGINFYKLVWKYYNKSRGKT